MQRTLDKLVGCGNRWDMDFNENKCGVIYMGNNTYRKKKFRVSVPDEGWLSQII